ncbi:hypothetical protein IscW_ISCW003333 [Ixodes scapularis]|uniref:Uncharacterized protein n=1 Tax=Ixodes scapularis TaxID=6945 RepID=B7PBZ0_IXOSC|nr:hypothetical protein IscW_ISCW003333 [Ixodes scapularis]|eukprot:XP_002409078.1 hypothetical protein IscW_ISCW003333 [Ixodes scapularis]
MCTKQIQKLRMSSGQHYMRHDSTCALYNLAFRAKKKKKKGLQFGVTPKQCAAANAMYILVPIPPPRMRTYPRSSHGHRKLKKREVWQVPRRSFAANESAARADMNAAGNQL